MSRLMRTDLFKIAEKAGWKKGEQLLGETRESVKQEIKLALRKSDFPPTKTYEADGTFRLMTVEEAAENLLEELV